MTEATLTIMAIMMAVVLATSFTGVVYLLLGETLAMVKELLYLLRGKEVVVKAEYNRLDLYLIGVLSAVPLWYLLH